MVINPEWKVFPKRAKVHTGNNIFDALKTGGQVLIGVIIVSMLVSLFNSNILSSIVTIGGLVLVIIVIVLEITSYKQDHEFIANSVVNKDAERTTNYLIELINNSNKLTTTVYPKALDTLSNNLKQAEILYYNNNYNGFWHMLIAAMNEINIIRNCVVSINENINIYKLIILENENTFPDKLPISSGLANPNKLITEFYTIRDNALTNHQFAIIWEMILQQKIMISGFNSLRDAIYHIGDQITETIDNLNKNLEEGFNRINNSIADSTNTIANHLSGIDDSIKKLDDKNKGLDLDELKRIVEKYSK